MTEKLSKRRLVPEDQVIVVLDTASARLLAYPNISPPWVNAFAEMSKQGYSFSLADNAITELFAQLSRGALSAVDCKRMCERLDLFLNPQLPLLLGKRDLMGMLQINESSWDEDECRQVSLRNWRQFKEGVDSNNALPSPEWVLQEERDNWVENLAKWQQAFDKTRGCTPVEDLDLDAISSVIVAGMARAQDTWSSIEPSMSVRLHLQNRYLCRQLIRMQKKENAYNPLSRKKRNDGIDADLYRYLQLPALVVTEDKGFLTGLDDIDSFQKNWFFKAEVLAAQWESGHAPVPAWPVGGE